MLLAGRHASQWESNQDGSATGRWTFDRNLTVMGFNEPLCGGETQAGASRFRREERREDLLSNFERDAWPAIDKCDLAARIDRTNGNANAAPAVHGVCAVDQQILKNDSQHVRIR